MRTCLEKAVYGFRGKLGLNDRPYEVDGVISFVLDSASSEPNLNQLRELIIETDFQFPWRDKNHFTGKEARSIGYLSDGFTKVDNWNTPEKSCHFSIYPGFKNLNKGQLHAYERYLANIAEELAKKKLPHVVLVRCVIHASIINGEFSVK